MDKHITYETLVRQVFKYATIEKIKIYTNSAMEGFTFYKNMF